MRFVARPRPAALVVAVLAWACATAPPAARDEAPPAAVPLALDAAVHDTAELAFVPHGGPGPFGSYLAMELPFAPVDRLRQALEERLGKALKHRGEAHVTVITPPEYDRWLRPHLTIAEVDEIALAGGIQRARFTVRCLGRASAELERDGSTEDIETARAYFLVIASDDLLAIRRAVHRALLARGGDAGGFDPERWQPHITVGFTHRDLHERDGARKGPESCWAPVREIGREIGRETGGDQSPAGAARRQRHSWWRSSPSTVPSTRATSVSPPSAARSRR